MTSTSDTRESLLRGDIGLYPEYTGTGPELDLQLVDTEGIFIVHDLSLTVITGAYEQAPEALTTIPETILEGLDDPTMAELNRRIDMAGDRIEDVAVDHLVDQGLIG